MFSLFFLKLRNGDLYQALLNANELTANEIDKIMEAVAKQNQLIGLIENGRTLQIRKVDDVWEISYEFITETEFRFIKDGIECSITIPGDIFIPTFRNEGGKILFNIPQIAPQWSSTDNQ